MKFFLILAFFPSLLFSESSGSSLLSFISEYPSARGFSMGSLSLPVSDCGSAYMNPAISAKINTNELSLSLWKDLDGVGNYGFLCFSKKPDNYGGFNLSYFYYTSGKEEIYDLYDNPSNITLEKDYVLSLGWGIKMTENFLIGAKVKNIKSTLAQEYSASSFAFDIGSIFEIEDTMAFSISYDNIGGELKYINESEPVSRSLRIEISSFQKIKAGVFSFGAGIKKYSFQDQVDLLTGVEFKFKNFPLALRSGLKREQENFKFSSGLGFSFKNFFFDYGIEYPQKFGKNIQRFTLSFLFGNDEDEEIKNKRKYVKIKNEAKEGSYRNKVVEKKEKIWEW